MLIFCSRVKLFDQGPGIFSLKDVDPITGATTSFPNAPGSTFSFLGTPAPTANGGLQHGFYPYFAHGPTSTSDDNIFGNGNYLQPEPLDHGTIQLDNTGNYPRSNKLDYHYQISFVDKGPILTTDIDKETELFDGIGEKGLVLVPDLLEGDIKKNIDFFLRKAGIIERRTIKSPFRPERGR